MQSRRYAAVFILLIAAVFATFSFSFAEQTQADKACTPENDYYKYRTDKPRNAKFTENKKEYFNMYGFPCKDVTSGKVTEGICVASSKCLAQKTDGEKPQTCAQAGSCAGEKPAATSPQPTDKPAETNPQPNSGGGAPNLPQPPGGGGGDQQPKPDATTPKPNELPKYDALGNYIGGMEDPDAATKPAETNSFGEQLKQAETSKGWFSDWLNQSSSLEQNNIVNPQPTDETPSGSLIDQARSDTTGFDNPTRGLNSDLTETKSIGERISETWGNFKDGASELYSDAKNFVSDTYTSARDYLNQTTGFETDFANNPTPTQEPLPPESESPPVEKPTVEVKPEVIDTVANPPSAQPFDNFGRSTEDPVLTRAEADREALSRKSDYDPLDAKDREDLANDKAELKRDIDAWQKQAEACKTGCSQDKIEQIKRDLTDLQKREGELNKQIDNYNKLIEQDKFIAGLQQNNPDLSKFTGPGPQTPEAQNVLNAERAALTEIAQQRANSFWTQTDMQSPILAAEQNRIANNAFEAAENKVTPQITSEAYRDLTRVQDGYDQRSIDAAKLQLADLKTQIANTPNDFRVTDALNGTVEQNPERAILERQAEALQNKIAGTEKAMEQRDMIRNFIFTNDNGDAAASTLLNNKDPGMQQALTDAIVKHQTEEAKLERFDNGESLDGRFSRSLGERFADWSRAAYSDPVDRANSTIAQLVGNEPMTSEVQKMLDTYSGNYNSFYKGLYAAQDYLRDAASLSNAQSNGLYPFTGTAAFLASTVVDPAVGVFGSREYALNAPLKSWQENAISYGNDIAMTALNATMIATPFMSPSRALMVLDGAAATGELSTLEKAAAFRDGKFAAYEQAVDAGNYSAARNFANEYNVANGRVERLGGEALSEIRVSEIGAGAASVAPVAESQVVRIESEIATVQTAAENKLTTFTPTEAQMTELTRPLTQATSPITATEQAAISRYNNAISEYTATQQQIADGALSANSPLARQAMTEYLQAGSELRNAGLMERPGLTSELGADNVYRAASGEVVASRVGAIANEVPYSVVTPATESAAAVQNAARASVAAEAPQQSIFDRMTQPVRDFFGTERPTPNTSYERPAFDTRPQTLTETLQKNVSDFFGFSEPRSLGSLTVQEAKAIDGLNNALAARSAAVPSNISRDGALLLQMQRADAVSTALTDLAAQDLHVRADGPIVRGNGEIVAAQLPLQVPGKAPYGITAPIETATRLDAIAQNAAAPSAEAAINNVTPLTPRATPAPINFARAIAAAVPLIVNPVSPTAMFSDLINAASNAVVTRAQAAPYTNEVAKNLAEGVRLVCKATGCDAPTYARALGGSCAQESGGCDPRMLHNGGASQYQGLGQLSKTSTFNAYRALERARSMGAYTPAEAADIDGVLTRTRDWLAGRSQFDVRFDPHDGSYLFAARQTYMPEMGGTTPLANIQRIAPGNPTIQARLIQATQLAPSIHNSGQINNLSAPLTAAQRAAFANNGLGAASTLGEVVGYMGYGGYNSNLSKGVAWMDAALTNGNISGPTYAAEQTLGPTSLASVPVPQTPQPPAVKDFETRLKEAYQKQQADIAAQNAQKPALSVTEQLEKRLQEKLQQQIDNAGPAARTTAPQAVLPKSIPIRFEPVPITQSYAAAPPRAPINVPYVEPAPVNLTDIALAPAPSTVVQDIPPATTPTTNVAQTPTVPNAVDVPTPVTSDPALLQKRLEETRAAEKKAQETFNKLTADMAPVNQKIAELQKQLNATNQGKSNLNLASQGLKTLEGLWSQPNPAQLSTMRNGTAAAARLSGNAAQLGDTGLASEIRGYVNLLNSMSLPENQTLANRNLAVSKGNDLVNRATTLLSNATAKANSVGNLAELQKTQAALNTELQGATRSLNAIKNVERTTVDQINKVPTIAVQETVPPTSLASVPPPSQIKVPEIEPAPIDLSDIRIAQVETPQFVRSVLPETKLSLPPKFTVEYTMYPYDAVGYPPTYTYGNPASLKAQITKALQDTAPDTLPASMRDQLDQLKANTPKISFTEAELNAIKWDKLGIDATNELTLALNPDYALGTGYRPPETIPYMREAMRDLIMPALAVRNYMPPSMLKKLTTENPYVESQSVDVVRFTKAELDAIPWKDLDKGAYEFLKGIVQQGRGDSVYKIPVENSNIEAGPQIFAAGQKNYENAIAATRPPVPTTEVAVGEQTVGPTSPASVPVPGETNAPAPTPEGPRPTEIGGVRRPEVEGGEPNPQTVTRVDDPPTPAPVDTTKIPTTPKPAEPVEKPAPQEQTPAPQEQTPTPVEQQPTVQNPTPNATTPPAQPAAQNPNVTPPASVPSQSNLWDNTKLGFKVMRAAVLPATGLKNAVALPITGLTALSIGGPAVLTWPALNVGWRMVFNSGFRNDVIGAFARGAAPTTVAVAPTTAVTPSTGIPSPTGALVQPTTPTPAPTTPTNTPPAGGAGGNGGGTPPTNPPTGFAPGGAPVPPPSGDSIGKMPWWIIGGTIGGLGTLAYLGGSNPYADAPETNTEPKPNNEPTDVLPCTARAITRDNMLRMLLGDSLSEVDCVPTPANILNNEPLPTIPDLGPATPQTPPGTRPPGTQTPPGVTGPGTVPPGITPPGSTIPGSGLGTGVSGVPTGGTNAGQSRGILSMLTGFLQGLVGAMQQRAAQPQPLPTNPAPVNPSPINPSVPSPNSTTTPVSVQMIAVPNPVSAGSSVRVSWASISATRCSAFTTQGVRIASGEPDSAVSFAAPATSTEYRVQCQNAAGKIATGSVLLIVR